MKEQEHREVHSLDASKLTVDQIRGVLTIRQWWILGVVAAGLLAGAFSAGKAYTEAIDGQRLSEATGHIDQYRSDLNRVNDEITRLKQVNDQLNKSNEVANSTIANLGLRLSSLDDLRDAQSNCDFVHTQINMANAQIEAEQSSDIFSNHGATKEEAAERVKQLEARIAGYQAQLASCLYTVPKS